MRRLIVAGLLYLTGIAIILLINPVDMLVTPVIYGCHVL